MSFIDYAVKKNGTIHVMHSKYFVLSLSIKIKKPCIFCSIVLKYVL